MIRTLFIGVLIFLFSASVLAHPWKPGHYVIIDTDGGIDDFRAIVMMLASPDIRVLAITTSDGVLDSKNAYIKVKSLLNDLYHEGIPVGMNYSDSKSANNFMHALDFKWGINYPLSDSIPEAVNVINELLDKASDKIEFICLGSLNTFEDLQKGNNFSVQKIKKIIWSSKYNYWENNFNYELDTNAFVNVDKLKLPMCIVEGEIPGFSYDKDFTDKLSSIHNPCSIKMLSGISLDNNSPYSNHSFDESLVLFLHFPGLFMSDTLDNIIRYKAFSNNTDAIRIGFGKIISGETVNQNQVLSSFPLDSSFYFQDVQKNLAGTIEKFGMEEWVACVLANEMHRHLGVYAIIGTKMGIRAREYFAAGIDEMKIISYAGTIPPFSCMNDGLQVSTGATLGHGLIKLSKDSFVSPRADFIYMGRKITVILKEMYRNKIVADVEELSSIYGLDSNIYWELIRIEALKYWNNWDRHEIFDIKENQQ